MIGMDAYSMMTFRHEDDECGGGGGGVGVVDGVEDEMDEVDMDDVVEMKELAIILDLLVPANNV